MKINLTPRLKADVDTIDLLRRMAYQINGLSEGSISAKYAARTAPPTTGTWARGDWVENSEPEELGPGGSKYVIQGWRCVVGGTPGTWLEARTLTGH